MPYSLTEELVLFWFHWFHYRLILYVVVSFPGGLLLSPAFVLITGCVFEKSSFCCYTSARRFCYPMYRTFSWGLSKSWENNNCSPKLKSRCALLYWTTTGLLFEQPMLPKCIQPKEKHPSKVTVNMTNLFQKIPRKKMALRFAKTAWI